MTNQWFPIYTEANVHQFGYARKCDRGDKFLAIVADSQTDEMTSGTYTAEQIRGFGMVSLRRGDGSVYFYPANVQGTLWGLWKTARGKVVPVRVEGVPV